MKSIRTCLTLAIAVELDVNATLTLPTPIYQHINILSLRYLVTLHDLAQSF